MTARFPSQRAKNAENISMSWPHHAFSGDHGLYIITMQIVFNISYHLYCYDGDISWEKTIDLCAT